MDPIEAITPAKDSTLAMMLAAQDLGHQIYYMGERDLYLKDGRAMAKAAHIRVKDDHGDWFEKDPATEIALGTLDQIFMRSDPPVDKGYITATYILDQAVRDGADVVNAPGALRNYNEKLYATLFPDFTPPTLVSANFDEIRAFVHRHGRAIIKPLDMMGGHGVYLTEKGDVNLDVICELQTENGAHPIIAQEFLPQIEQGDRRVLILNGEAYPHVLVRLPKQGSMRGNLAAGGSYDVQPLNERDKEIAEAVIPQLNKDGVRFAGLDVIGGRLIEINHTSPTGLREISKHVGENIARHLF